MSGENWPSQEEAGGCGDRPAEFAEDSKELSDCYELCVKISLENHLQAPMLPNICGACSSHNIAALRALKDLSWVDGISALSIQGQKMDFCVMTFGNDVGRQLVPSLKCNWRRARGRPV